MNIRESIIFSPEKPAVLAIHKSEKINILAVGLQKGQILKKHLTHFPTLLTVIQGTIEFSIGEKRFELKEMDTYHIPVEVEHEVKGLQNKNIFTLVQEK